MLINDILDRYDIFCFYRYPGYGYTFLALFFVGEKMKHCKRKVIAFLSLALFTGLTGCAGLLSGSWAKIAPDAEVKKAFESFQVNPDYNYFYSGSDLYPHSLLGLSKAYKLESDIWIKMEITPQKLQETVSNMQAQALKYVFSEKLFGFAVTDNNGRQIGIWYSLMVPGFSLNIRDDGRVIVSPPNDNQYMQYDGQADGQKSIRQH